MFGPLVTDEARKAEEGRPQEEQITGGIEFHSRKETFRLPEAKFARVKPPASALAFAPGSRRPRLKELQEILGLPQFGSVARLALPPEPGALSRLMTRSETSAAFQREPPRGADEETEEAWCECDEATEAARLPAEVPESWDAHFTTGLCNLLDARERVALPDCKELQLRAGGDSTLETRDCTDGGRGQS